MLREALTTMGREDLIGSAKHQLIPIFQPKDGEAYKSPRRKNSTPRQQSNNKSANNNQPRRGRILTQHTGLPPRKHS
jgi:hypothetical protein